MPWSRTRAYPHAFAVPDHKLGGGYNFMVCACGHFVPLIVVFLTVPILRRTLCSIISFGERPPVKSIDGVRRLYIFDPPVSKLCSSSGFPSSTTSGQL